MSYSSFVGVEVFQVEVFDRSLQDSSTINPLACLSTTSSITVTEISGSLITLGSNATNETFCDGDNVTFTATAIVSATYQFFVGGGLQADSASNTFSTNVLANNSNVRVIVTFDNGCTATTSLTVTKNDITSAGTISGTQVICFNTVPNPITSLTTATESSGTATITYRWEFSNTGLPGSFLPTGVEGPPPATLSYSPGPLIQDVWYRRVAISELNNVICESPTALPATKITVIENRLDF